MRQSYEIGKDKTVAKDNTHQVPEKKPCQPTAKPFWQKIQEIGAKPPREEWEKLPKDFARNFESYMYRVPKEQ